MKRIKKTNINNTIRKNKQGQEKENDHLKKDFFLIKEINKHRNKEGMKEGKRTLKTKGLKMDEVRKKMH